jgi:hypothetical protein
MQVRESDQSHLVVEFSHNELILVNNALNEVCHGLDLPDFTTRLGASRKELETLLAQVQRALEGMGKRPDEG